MCEGAGPEGQEDKKGHWEKRQCHVLQISVYLSSVCLSTYLYLYVYLPPFCRVGDIKAGYCSGRKGQPLRELRTYVCILDISSIALEIRTLYPLSQVRSVGSV